MKTLRQLLASVSLGALALAFFHFGPAEYTRVVSDTPFYHFYLAPLMDKLVVAISQDKAFLGYITRVDGQVTLASGKVAYKGQLLFEKAILQTRGSAARATVRFRDGSELRMEAGSEVRLGGDFSFAPGKLDLKLNHGTMIVEKGPASLAEVKMTSVKDVQKVVPSNAWIIIGPRPLKVAKSAPDAARALGAESEEFIGPLSLIENPDETLARLAADKAETLQIQQKSMLAQAEIAEAARLKADRRPTSLGGPVKLAVPRKVWHRVEAVAKPLLERALYGAPKIKASRAIASVSVEALDTDFNDATHLALEDTMRDYVETQNCHEANETLENVTKKYPDNVDAEDWVSAWQLKLSHVACAAE